MANKNRKRAFFDEDTEHGLVKRIMLKKYLQAYMEATQSEKYTLRTMVIDGFAGAGRYGKEWPDEIERYGSPLIALMIALDVYYRKDTKKQKQEKLKQARSGEDETQGLPKESGMQEKSNGRNDLETLGKRGTNVLPEKSGMQGPEESEMNSMSGEYKVLEERDTHGISERSGLHEGLEESKMERMAKESGQKEGLRDRKTHGRSEESERQHSEESETQLTSGERETLGRQEKKGSAWEEIETFDSVSVGASFQESTCNKLKKGEDTKDSLWGWPASEMDPETELAFELEQLNRRNLFGAKQRTITSAMRQSLSYSALDINEETLSDIKNCIKHANISLLFIENDTKTYKQLAANVELVITKFLKRCYPSYKYGFRSTKGKVRIYLSTAPFSISVKIVKGKFADTKPPPMLNDSLVRSLTFLDPFGFTQTPMSHIAKFAPGPGNDILINFMSSYVNRFVSRSAEGVVELYGMSDYKEVAKLYGIDPPDLENDDYLVEFVKYVIHFCQPEREHLFSNEINKCTSNYEDFLKQKTNSKYSLTFEVKDQGNTTIYHMIHITNHIRGVEAMKESMNRCSQREGEMIMSEYDIVRKGQKLNLGNLDDPIKVAEAIFNKFRGKKFIPIGDIQKYILFDTNYLFRKIPLKKLQKAGMITDVVDTEGNNQIRKHQFPGIDKSTNEPIVWLISFDDEEYNTDIANRLHAAEGENQRKRNERQKNARKRKEQKEEETLLRKERQREKMIQREKRRKEIEEKKKKTDEERLVRKRKKEERRRQIEENKKKRNEAKLEKQRKKDEKEKRKEEQMIKAMRSQKLITDFLRTGCSQRLVGETQSGRAGDFSRECSEPETVEVDSEPETDESNEINDRRQAVSEEPSGSGIRKEQKRLRGKENGRKTKAQKRITETFVSKKRVENPLTEKSADRKKTETRKRKMPETPRNKNTPAKRRAGTSVIDKSMSDNAFGANVEPSSNCKRGEKPMQKVLTEYFQRKDNCTM